MLKLIVAALLLIIPIQSVSATIDYGRTIAKLGTQANNGYVLFSVAPSAGCSYDTLYIDITTDVGKARYQMLLTAYSVGRLITRVDYTKTSGTCYIDLIEF